MKKDLFNLKKGRWLLLTIFSLILGSNAAWAETLTETFDEVTVTSRYLLSNGWVMVHSNGSYQGFGGSYDYQLKSGNYDGETGNCLYNKYSDDNEYVIIPTKLTGTFTYYAKRAESSNGTVTFFEATKSGDTFSVTSTQLATVSTTSSWGSQKSFSLGNEGKYVAIRLKFSRIDQISATIYKDIAGPSLTVKDGTTNVTSPYSYNFGLATTGTTKTFTLSNPGTAALDVSVSETGNFNATLSATTIAAGGEVTLTTTMPSTSGNSTITITPATGSGINPFVINVSGTIRDANKLYENGFTALPTDWTTTGTWNYNANNGAYTTVWSLTSNARLITPKLTISEGETFFVEAKGYSTSNTSYQHLQMQYSADGTTWTNFDSEPTLDPSSWKTFAFTGVPAGKYYIAINASQADIRMFYGGELPNEPKMVVNQPTSLAFTAVQKDEVDPSLTFTIANTGKATLEGIYVSSSNPAFTISGVTTSLAAGTSQEVTITMSSASVGNLSADITVSATDMSDVQFTVTGVVLPIGLSIIDFNDDKLPEMWTNISSASYYQWTFSDNEAYKPSTTASYDANNYMQTPKVSVNNGDMIALRVKKSDSSMARLTLKGLADDNTEVYSKDITLQTDYQWVLLDNIPTTVKYFRFHGSYAYIDEIRGINYDQNSPVMTVNPTTDADFGKVKAQPEAKTYTITNSGTGTLTGTITSSEPTVFTVSKADFSLAAGESTTFDIALVFDSNYGAKASVITIHPTVDGLTDVVINVTATTADPNIWEEDFEAGMPATWINNGWTVSSSNYGNNGTKMAYATNNNGTTLITPRLEATNGQELTFEVGGADSTDPLTVEYSNDRSTWTALTGSPITTTGQQTFTAPADGYYYLRFSGRYCSVDNFYGFKEAPLGHDASIASVNIPNTGNQYVEYTATVTVKEMAGKNEELTAKFFIGTNQYGTDVVETVEANGSKTFTVTFTPDTELNGEAYFTISNANLTLESDKVAVTIAEALVIDEGVVSALTDGNAASVAVNFTAKAGWNTICMPFALSNDDMKAIFGDGWKAYEFKSYANDELHFDVASKFFAGYPYIVYSENPASTQLKKQNVTIEADVHADEYGGAKFQGTYAPIAAPNMEGKYGVVPSTGKIQKGGDQASIKGFRAYFELPSGAPGARLSFTDVTTGITTVMDASVLGDDAFNLKGQRVENLKKGGLYIIGGKKVIVK